MYIYVSLFLLRFSRYLIVNELSFSHLLMTTHV
nr:MAG TPA_asm: hypothetical protein [Caudoviricetes sp.]